MADFFNFDDFDFGDSKSGKLPPQQVRLLKTINAYLQALSVTQDEKEFFEGASELLRSFAAFLKQSSYIKDLENEFREEYSLQAIEYAIENLYENLSSRSVVKFDN